MFITTVRYRPSTANGSGSSFVLLVRRPKTNVTAAVPIYKADIHYVSDACARLLSCGCDDAMPLVRRGEPLPFENFTVSCLANASLSSRRSIFPFRFVGSRSRHIHREGSM